MNISKEISIETKLPDEEVIRIIDKNFTEFSLKTKVDIKMREK